MTRRIFKQTGSLQPGRSSFDLSYEKKFTCDMGQLIPVMCDEAVPGDIWTIGNQTVIRFNPLVSPVLHEINMYLHIFFVPYRLLWEDWENFISGGVDGDDESELPRWEPINTAVGSLWDYLGFPTGVDPDGAYPMSFPRDAYNLIYNEYYRDETIQDELLLTQESIVNRCWEKDYFTSSLLWQQRGTAPALPISGSTSAVWNIVDTAAAVSPGNIYVSPTVGDTKLYAVNPSGNERNNLIDFFNKNTVDLSVASTFDIADLRLAFQIQKWMERNARAGVRYTEFLRSHFGVSPRDDRLDRPEYIGGSKCPIIISEVLQTSATDSEPTPQGNLAGHGIGVNTNFCGKYRVEEFGLIMGIMSVMPRSAYQQGINRQWLRRTKYDFYFPEFANLSEQAIERAEIYASDVEAENLTVFGYQGRYDEMRIKPNIVCGQMRDTFDYWHLGRQFSAPPTLDSTFLTCTPSKRIFAAESEPGLIVSHGNIIKAVRPMPISAEPGLIDHN